MVGLLSMVLLQGCSAAVRLLVFIQRLCIL